MGRSLELPRASVNGDIGDLAGRPEHDEAIDELSAGIAQRLAHDLAAGALLHVLEDDIGRHETVLGDDGTGLAPLDAAGLGRMRRMRATGSRKGRHDRWLQYPPHGLVPISFLGRTVKQAP